MTKAKFQDQQELFVCIHDANTNLLKVDKAIVKGFNRINDVVIYDFGFANIEEKYCFASAVDAEKNCKMFNKDLEKTKNNRIL